MDSDDCGSVCCFEFSFISAWVKATVVVFVCNRLGVNSKGAMQAGIEPRKKITGNENKGNGEMKN